MQVTLTKEAEETIKQSEALIDIYKSYKVSTPAQHSMAIEDLMAIKERIKKLDETRKSITRPIDEAKARVMDIFRKPLECLEIVKNKINDEVVRYEKVLEQERQLQQQKLIDEAKAKEAKERAKLEAQAKKAEEKGNEGKAGFLRQQAQEVQVNPMIVSSDIDRKGIGKRKVWKFKITDEALIPRDYMIIDMIKIGQIVRANQLSTKIPGVSVYFEEVLA